MDSIDSSISLDLLNSEIKFALFESPSSFALKVHTLIVRMMHEMALNQVLALERRFRSSIQIDSYNALLISGAVEAIITKVKEAKERQAAKSSLPSSRPEHPKCTPLMADISEQATIPLERLEKSPEIPAGLNKGILRRSGKLQMNNRKVLQRSPRFNSALLGKSYAYTDIYVLRYIYPEENIKLLPSYKINQALKGIRNMFLILTGRQKSNFDKETKISLQKTLTQAKRSLISEDKHYKVALKGEDPIVFLRLLMKKQTTMQIILDLTMTLHRKGAFPATQEVDCDEIIKEAGEDLMKTLLVESGVHHSELDEEMPDECRVS